jgi:uncharacterized protein YndB with AHSA1/START domain
MTDAPPTVATAATATDATPVRKTVTVEASKEHAFSVFTDGFSTWWPIDTHHIGAADVATMGIEPYVGGRCYERGVDGSECEWARVKVFEPPDRLVVVWQLNADWAYDPGMTSEVEVHFVAEGPHTTRVELEHRGLDSYGVRSGEVRAALDSEGGWGGLIARFAGAAAA